MASITDVKRKGGDSGWEMNAVIASLVLPVISTFASGFFQAQQVSKSLPVELRILVKLQEADCRLFLIPVALHPWKALLIAALATFCLRYMDFLESGSGTRGRVVRCRPVRSRGGDRHRSGDVLHGGDNGLDGRR